MERRTEKRHPVIRSFVYSDCSHLGDLTLMTAMVADVSKSGACLYTQRRYGRGEVISVCSKAFGSELREATVRWIRLVSDGVYKIGISLN